MPRVCRTYRIQGSLCLAFLESQEASSACEPAPKYLFSIFQDTVGGRFDATQAFVGELSQFNIWDRVLRAQEIINIANCSTNMPGNIIPWVDNNVDVFGGASKWPVETCEERLLDL